MESAMISAGEVERRLRASVPGVEALEVEDVSDGHTSTAAALASGRSQLAGGREFRILIISAVFEGMALIDRQRLVTGALAAELESGAIHSLPALRAWTPAQLAACQRRGTDSRCTALEAVRSMQGAERQARLAAEADAEESSATLAQLESELLQTQAEIAARSPKRRERAEDAPPATEAAVPCACGEDTVGGGGAAPPAAAVPPSPSGYPRIPKQDTGLAAKSMVDNKALSVIVRANNGRQSRLRFPWIAVCEMEGEQWTVQPTDTIGRLKELIAERIGMPPPAQQLLAAGGSHGGSTVVRDEQRLVDAGLVGGTAVWLSRR